MVFTPLTNGEIALKTHLSGRVVVFGTGEVVSDGSAQEVLDNAALRHEYLGI